MSIYLICVTTNGGLPILTRKKGDCENLPFSTIASLNGLHMFFKSLGVSLYTTYTGNWTYVWQDFFNTITIIVCSCGIGNYTTELLPDIIFGAFSLFISRDELSHPSFLERLKKESKNYTHLIDAILESCVSQLLGFSSCLISMENSQMLQRLNEEFSIQCGSLFCSLVVGHKLAVATEGWWDLDIVDRQLLLLFLQTSSSLQNDVVLYLPKKSPNVAYRFITLSVSSNSVLCVISGAEPSLRILHDIAENTFRGESNLLLNMESSIPRGLPEHIELDSSIVSIILANSITRKCVFASNIHHSASTKRYLGDFHKMDVLRRIFDDSFTNAKLFKSTCSHICEVSSQYWSLDTHKCMSMFDSNDNIICLLFISSIPLHTMKCEKIWSKTKRPKSYETIFEIIKVTLKTPTVTRSNSLFDSIQQLIQFKDKIREITNAFEMEDFSNDDFEYLEEYIKLIKPIAVALDFFQSEKDVYYGYLFPTLLTLKLKLKKPSNSLLLLGNVGEGYIAKLAFSQIIQEKSICW